MTARPLFPSLCVQSKEETDATLAKLQKENRALKKRAAKLPALEKAMAESAHDDVVRLRKEGEHMRARVQLLEGNLEQVTESRGKLQEALDDLKAEASASSWLFKEHLAEREEAVQSHAARLKEGLAKRVVRQWTLRVANQCFRAWQEYCMKRQLRRELGKPTESDREATSAAQEAMRATQPPPPQKRIADAMSQGVSAIANYF